MESSSDSESDIENNPDDEYVPPRRSERIAKRMKYTSDPSVALEETSDSSSDDHGDEAVPDKCTLNTTPTRVCKKATVKPKRKQSKATTAKSKKKTAASTSKKGALNKTTRNVIIKSIRDIPLDTIIEQVKVQLYKEQFLYNKETYTKILDELVSSTSLFRSLIEHHRTTFVTVYGQNATGKEKYLRFQMEWHSQCSIFLLPKYKDIDCIISEPSKLLSDIRGTWLKFCDKYLSESELCNKIMILLSSSVYTILLDHVHSCTCISQSTSAVPQDVDGDDVQYRFGGAVLSDMLHLRYKTIRKCPTSKIEMVSLEIEILHAINTKEKSKMPSYLKYRDRGHMYTPHPDFISFFRDVDNYVKDVVTTEGFQEHGDNLVKVKSHNLHVVSL